MLMQVVQQCRMRLLIFYVAQQLRRELMRETVPLIMWLNWFTQVQNRVTSRRIQSLRKRTRIDRGCCSVGETGLNAKICDKRLWKPALFSCVFLQPGNKIVEIRIPLPVLERKNCP
jgi:hypothetical protein